MSKDSSRIRLPELPIFKKYSLAVRQEFASAKELVSVLERSLSRVEKLAAMEQDREQSQPIDAEPDTDSEASDEAAAALELVSPPKSKIGARKVKPKTKARSQREVVRVSTRGTPVGKRALPKKKTATKRTAGSRRS